MPRFFIPKDACPSGEAVGERIVIEGSDARHIGLSLRMKCGDPLTVSDGRAREYECRIAAIEPERVCLEVLSVCETAKESPCRITVYQAFCKGDKMEGIVRRAVELGADAVVPVYSDHIVSRPDASSAGKKIARWQKIAEEAAKQCGRGKLPRILPAVEFKTMLREMKDVPLRFLCYENEDRLSLKGLLAEGTVPSECAFFVGPEGGLSGAEVAAADAAGIARVSLGSRILRAETAAPAVLSMLLYAWEL